MISRALTSRTPNDDMSPEYVAALTAHDAALAIYDEARCAYHCNELGDEPFLAARAVMMAANKAFDLAFDAERARVEALDAAPPAAEPVDDSQSSLF